MEQENNSQNINLFKAEKLDNEQVVVNNAQTSEVAQASGVPLDLANVNVKKIAPKPQAPVNYEFNCKNNVYFEAPKNLNYVYYSVGIFFIIFVIWASLAKIDQVTNGYGKVVPSEHVKIVQSLDGGVIEKIYIKDGELVKAGQLLIKLEDARYTSEYNQNYTQMLMLIAEISRLKAELLLSSSVKFPSDLNDYPEIRIGQTKLFTAVMKAYENEKESLEHDIKLSEQEAGIILPLVEQGLMTQMERIRVEKQVAESKNKLDSMVGSFKTKAQSDLAEKQSNKISLEEKLKGLADRISHTEITSPVSGYVHDFKFNTIGGVIKPGIDILDVVPLEDQIIIEAKINPKDRAFIKKDQAAVVKFPAYDSSIYGDINGKVISISPDTEKDEKNNEFYLVRLVTEKNYLGNDVTKKVIPGMAANVNILTGKKTILYYLLKPVVKIKENALQEA